MSLRAVIADYTLYNYWANKRLTQWLTGLDAKLLYQKTESSFSSIDLTLQHMKNAQNFWYAVITNDSLAHLDETILLNSVNIVIEELLKGSQKMINKYNAFSEKELLTEVTSPVSPDMVQKKYKFILHTVDHNSYHRGQIISMIRFLGIYKDIPATSYEAFLWFKNK